MRLMLRLLSWLVSVPLGLLVVLFAISNREPVTVALFPLDGALEMPLYLIVLAMGALCFLTGALIGWSRALPARIRAGAARREAGRWKGEAKRLDDQLKKASAPPPPHTITSHDGLQAPETNTGTGRSAATLPPPPGRAA